MACLAVIVGRAGIAWQVRQTDRASQEAQEQYRRFAEVADEKFNVVEDLMQRVPEDQRAQDERLASALETYEVWLAEEPTGEAAQASYADALLRVAEIRRRLGQFNKAEPVYERACDHYRRLTAAAPSEPRYRHGLAEALNWLGENYRERGDPAPAIAVYEQAMQHQRSLVEARIKNAINDFFQEQAEIRKDLIPGFRRYEAWRAELSS